MIAQAIADWLIPGLVGAGAIVAGSWAGWRFRGRAPRKPMCTCGHGYGTHDVGQRCADQIKRVTNGHAEWVDCPCRSYDGPDPLLIR